MQVMAHERGRRGSEEACAGGDEGDVVGACVCFGGGGVVERGRAGGVCGCVQLCIAFGVPLSSS
jgi:hypothetical protein